MTANINSLSTRERLAAAKFDWVRTWDASPTTCIRDDLHAGDHLH
jgi:hypothetical protein